LRIMNIQDITIKEAKKGLNWWVFNMAS